MKKHIAFIMALTLALSLFGCAKQTAQSGNGKETEENKTEQTDQKTENSEPTVTIAETAAWRYVLTTETRTEEEKNDAGVLLATTSYELPTLTAVCDDASQEPPEVQRRVCEAFNKRVAELSQGLNPVNKLAEGAREQYNEMGEEFRKNFPTHSEELRVSANRQSGDLLEVSFQTYGFWGGAHGGSSFFTWHYDLADGVFVELAELSDKPEELNRMIANEVIDAIGKANDPDSYFEDYAETIRAKDSFEVSFGADAMDVSFAQYEIAPYATGMPTFSISYEKLAPYLNERGQRLLAAFSPPSEKTAEGARELTAHFFDAGKADAILLSTARSAVLIDTGEKGFGKTILTHLEEAGIKMLDYLIITHFDKDHVGGAAKIINTIPVGTVLQSSRTKDSKEYEKYVRALDAANLEPVTVREGNTFTLDGVQYTVDPPRQAEYGEKDSNNSSLIASVRNGGSRFLLTGDAQTERLSEYLDSGGAACDVLKIPHHGKDEPLLSALLEAAKPTYAVITSSDDEPESTAVIETLERAGVKVLLTRQGAVTLRSDGTSVVILDNHRGGSLTGSLLG